MTISHTDERARAREVLAHLREQARVGMFEKKGHLVTYGKSADVIESLLATEREEAAISRVGDGEADYRKWRDESPECQPDGTLESLAICAGMLEEYGPECFPANEQGQITFARSMMESTASEIRAYLATLPGDPQ